MRCNGPATLTAEEKWGISRRVLKKNGPFLRHLFGEVFLDEKIGQKLTINNKER
jgi:hypothetical protein